MRPSLSATRAYNYNRAKWLEQKLKPVSLNEYTITDAFAFADEIRPPFKDQVAANAVWKQLRDLSHKIGPTLQPVFVSKKLGQHLKPKDIKPLVVNKQSVVYHFSCDLCEADYVGYTARHLHRRIVEHKISAIGRHFVEAHVNNNLLKENQFTVLRKCKSKFDGLVFEMLFIKNLEPNLNAQKYTCELFCLILLIFFFLFFHVAIFYQLLLFSIYRPKLTNIF